MPDRGDDPHDSPHDWSPIGLTPAAFAEAFPFHLVLDADLRVRQVGPTLARLLPTLLPGNRLTDHLRILRPPIALTYDAVVAHPRSVYLLEVIGSPLKLKGQMLPQPAARQILFLGSPAVTDVAALAAVGLTIDDFPIHDTTVDFLLLLQSTNTTLVDLRRMTETLRVERAEFRAARERLQHLLAASQTVIYASRPDDFAPTFVSDNAVRLLGPAAASFGRAFIDARVHPEDRERVHGAFARALAEGRAVVAWRMSQDNGRYRWRHESLQAVTADDGSVGELVGASQDVHDLMEAERALRESERRTDAMLETALDGILAVDGQGHILEFNRAASDIFGTSAADVLGQSLTTLFPEFQREAVAAGLASIDGGSPAFSGQRIELVACRRDGREFPIEFAMTQVAQELEPLFFVFVRDITARRESERALREREQAYRAVVNSVKEVIFQTDATGRWTFLNPAWTEITGFTVAESLGVNFLDYVHPDDRQRNLEAFAPLINREKPYCRHEVRYRTNSGGFRWIEVFARLVTDDQGTAVGTSGTLNDITERRLAADRLRSSEARTRAIVDTAAEGILTLDELGVIQMANAAAGRIFAMGAEQLAGRHVRDVLPALSWRQLDAGAGATYELDGRRGDGTTVPVSLALSRTVVDGEPLVTGILRDLTGPRREQEELRRARDQAESANRAKSDFIAAMSHEVRTPLHAILGMTELALATDLTPEQQQFIHTIRSASDALSFIINDVLDFSKIEAGQMDIETVAFDPWDVIEGVAETAGVRAAAKNIELICAIDPRLPHSIAGDPNRLRQVLLNLAGNAVKFTEQGEVEVRVEVSPPGDMVDHLHVQVRDTGIGISEDEQPRIFERFFQARSSSTTHRAGGTGLGLSITRSLVELMGGHITFSSQPGVGTTFDVVLPLGHPERAAVAPPLRQQRAILVVAQSASLRAVRTAQLQWLHFDVETAVSAAEALALLRQRRFDFALIGQTLPDMSGFELARQIRVQDLLPVKHVLLVGHATGAQAASPFVGAFLSKPLRLRRLVEALGEGPAGDPQGRPVTAAAAGATPAGVPSRILLAEDNPANVILATRILTSAGHQVDVAEDGEAAVVAANQRRYDLILMDLQMPKMDGTQATTAIRSAEQSRGEAPVPIVAVTAHAVDGFLDRCLQAGMNDYVTKPLPKRRLLEVVERWSDRRPAILVADDSPESEMLTRHHLRDYTGYRLVVVRNGRLALEQFDRQNVALVMLDMRMPVLDGFDTATAIRQRPHGATVPIIAMTGLDTAAERQRAAAVGCTAYLVKPVNRARLLAAIDDSLQSAAPAPSPAAPVAAEAPLLIADPDIASLLPGYIEARQREAVQLRQLLASGDLDRMAIIGHNLKGTGGGYGIPVLTAIGRDLERAARERRGDAIAPLLDRLDQVLEQVTSLVHPLR